MIRFAILKEVAKTSEGQTVVLEYDDKQVLARLQARIRENLSEGEKFIKHSFTKDEVKKALDKAFANLITEFKEKTITLV